PQSDRVAGVRFGLLGGLGLGLFNVFVSRFTPGAVFAPLVVVRIFEALTVASFVVGTHRQWRVPLPALLIAVVVGLGDMAGNGFFILAAQAGRLDIASVLSSLYPVTTIVLATVFLHERVTRRHALGIGLAFAAIALIAGG
ncbi:MAG TPA: EamA family transporter, partial [Candidatus Acidoferrum sp.]|nr:EamA family transporter [Candidatus Acidoferrum sp.]